jgi:hypothetical protein
MSENWHKKEEKRLKIESELLKKHSKYIIRRNKKLNPEKFYCDKKKEDCDPLKNCQMVTKKQDLKTLQEIEYLMKTDSGFTIAKSYCTQIGKCIGYNDFFHNITVTAAENRLIDIKNNNAIFYHYFYSAHDKSYQPLYNITNLKSGNELYLNDKPHFSPDGKTMVEIRSIPEQARRIGASKSNFPTGFNINIYELDKNNEYKKITLPQREPLGPTKISPSFLSQNSKCGKNPHFHSWKSNHEIRLSQLTPKRANKGDRTILAYDEKTKEWGCRKEFFPEEKCESYVPDSAEFSSNLSEKQIRDCR